MPLKLTRTMPHVVTVDGESIHLSLRRMTVDEFVRFEAEFVAYAKGRTIVPPDPAEATSAEDFQARVAARATGGLDYVSWQRDVFDQYVTVREGDLTYEGDAITSGRRFVDVMARYGNAVANVLAELYLRNKLSDEQKKTLGSPRASATSSSAAPETGANGNAPAMTAAPAAPKGSAPDAAVMAPSSDPSSGMTGPSSSASAPSGV